GLLMVPICLSLVVPASALPIVTNAAAAMLAASNPVHFLGIFVPPFRGCSLFVRVSLLYWHSDYPIDRGSARLALGPLVLQSRHRLLDMAREHVFGRPLPLERDLFRHGAVGADARERHAERLQGPLHCIHDGGRLVAAVHHAVRAFLVVAGTVGVPIRLGHQLMEALGVTLAQEIAGPLPAEIVPGRIAPGR